MLSLYYCFFYTLFYDLFLTSLSSFSKFKNLFSINYFTIYFATHYLLNLKFVHYMKYVSYIYFSYLMYIFNLLKIKNEFLILMHTLENPKTLVFQINHSQTFQVFCFHFFTLIFNTFISFISKFHFDTIGSTRYYISFVTCQILRFHYYHLI